MLSDIKIRQAKGTGKRQRLYDERGLYLEVTPPGGKCWRFKYRFDGKEKRIGFGIYPDVPLALARERRDEARQLLAKGLDPSAVRQAQKASSALRSQNSFEVIAREWYLRYSSNWADSHAKTVIRRLEKDIFPGWAIALSQRLQPLNCWQSSDRLRSRLRHN